MSADCIGGIPSLAGLDNSRVAALENQTPNLNAKQIATLDPKACPALTEKALGGLGMIFFFFKNWFLLMIFF